MLSALRLQHFRCLQPLDCQIGPGLSLFIGDNAQGKTSILEAVCVLLRLTSPRAGSLGELAAFGQDIPSFGISGHWADQALTYKWTDGTRSLQRDGAEAKLGEYLESSGLLVWMGNEDLTLIRGSSEARRRYLDFLGSQLFPAYLPALRSYDKALKSRNRLLKDDRLDWAQIESFSVHLIRHGEILTELRQRLCAELQPLVQAAHLAVSGKAETLILAYRSGSSREGLSFAQTLAATQEEERRRRVTVVGPHRDDVALTLNSGDVAVYASEGQQRTVALALKLAQARRLEQKLGAPPLLLIDDVFGELDPSRRQALLRALPSGAQQLITTTTLHWLDESGLSPDHTFNVAAGVVTPCSRLK